MDFITKMKDFEDKAFRIALTSGDMDKYLRGIEPYTISSGNMASEVVINTGAIMNKIYTYYIETKDNLVVEEVYKALIKLSNMKSFLSVYTVLDIERYQLEAEKSGKAPFNIEHIEILNNLKKNLQENAIFYAQAGELGNNKLPNGMMHLVQSYNQEFTQKHGRSIL